MKTPLVACICALSVACAAQVSKEQHFESGERLLREGRAAEAVVAFQNAIAADKLWPQAHYQLAEALAAANDRPTFHPARREGMTVRPLRWFGSADLRGLLSSDALIVLPPGTVEYEPGRVVDVIVV